MEHSTGSDGHNRRNVLAGAGVGIGVMALAACGDETSSGGATTTPSATGSDPAAPSASAPPTTSASSAPAAALAALADVPVGGGLVLRDEELVLTQPTAGEVLAFNAHCTHQGCLVTGVSSTIDCSCHGSKFDLTDGSPVAGPATAALPSEAVAVVDGNVVRQ